jgi:galactokinase/mevalonate kinase-like predicted kinase
VEVGAFMGMCVNSELVSSSNIPQCVNSGLGSSSTNVSVLTLGWCKALLLSVC